MADEIGDGAEAGGGEDLEGGDAAKVAPVGAVGRPYKSGVVVAEVLSGEESGAVEEGGVVLSEAGFGGGGGGDDEGGAGAEAEGEDGAVASGEGGEGLVEGFFEEVEVAEERERGRAWRRVLVAAAAEGGEEEEEEEEKNGEGKRDGFHQISAEASSIMKNAAFTAYLYIKK